MPPRNPLLATELDPDPVIQFRIWFKAAADAQIPQPEAAAIATATAAGRPSCRMVLVKEVDETGFVFYTNYESRKGHEVSENPQAALLFHWEQLERQVRVEGDIARTSREQSVKYAHSRARASQLSALASAQSRPVADREELERRVAELDAGEGACVPVPESWGGLRLSPSRFEFWQAGDARLHDRFVYERGNHGGWEITRLQP